MQIVTIEVLNENTLALLKQLEQLRVLRVIATQQSEPTPQRQWAGSLSQETGEKMLEHLDELRNEWERNI